MRINLYLFFLFFSFSVSAQDIHFAHIHASPTILNPAMTGLINNGNVRFIANARSQWQSVTNAYKTVAGSVDGKLAGLGDNNFLGGGLQLMGDKAGDLGFSKMSAGLTMSVLKALDGQGNNYISFGLRGSLYNYRLDYSKMVGFDSEPLVDAGAPNSFSFLDVSAGLAWYYNFNKHSTVYLGGAYFHINNPNTSFFNRTESEESQEYYGYDKLYRKIVLHGGGNIRLGKYVTALPSFIFMDQGPHQEINMGSFVKFLKSSSMKETNSAFYIGAWFRYYAEGDVGGTDALIAAVRMDINQTYLTFSFDFNLSSLTVASNGAGGPEISIVQILSVPKDKRKNSRVKCPAF